MASLYKTFKLLLSHMLIVNSLVQAASTHYAQPIVYNPLRHAYFIGQSPILVHNVCVDVNIYGLDLIERGVITEEEDTLIIRLARQDLDKLLYQTDTQPPIDAGRGGLNTAIIQRLRAIGFTSSATSKGKRIGTEFTRVQQIKIPRPIYEEMLRQFKFSVNKRFETVWAEWQATHSLPQDPVGEHAAGSINPPDQPGPSGLLANDNRPGPSGVQLGAVRVIQKTPPKRKLSSTTDDISSAKKIWRPWESPDR